MYCDYKYIVILINKYYCIIHHYYYYTDHMNFYKMVDLLYRESRLLEVNGTLVSLQKLSKITTKKYIYINRELILLFNIYESHQISIEYYLTKCSQLINSENYMVVT